MNKNLLSFWVKLILIGSVIVLLIGTAFAHFVLSSQVQEENRIKLSSVLNTTYESFNMWREGQIATLTQWRRRPELSERIVALLEVEPTADMLSFHSEQQDLRTLLRDWVIDYGYLGYFVISPDGTNLASMRDENLGQTNLVKLQMPETFAKVMRGQSLVTRPLVSDVPVTDAFGRLSKDAATMFAMVPVFSETGDVIAIFSARIDPAVSFSAVFQSGRIGITGETYAVDKNGVMISESRFNTQLQDIGLLNRNQPSMLNVAVRDPGVDLTVREKTTIPKNERPLTMMAQNALEGQSGSNLLGYNDYRGVKVVGAWLWDEEHQMAIATEQNEKEAYAGLRSALFTIDVFAGTGVVFFIVTYVAGIWVRRRLEERDLAAAQSQYELRLIMKSAGDGICGIDSKGDITVVNPKACELLGYKEQELIGLSLQSTIHHSYPDGTPFPANENKMLHAVTDGQVHEADDEVLWRKDGASFPVSYTSTPIWEKGKLVGAVVIFKDISERIQSREAMRRGLKAAEDANRAKSTFLSSMSHELRTPLNAVLGFSQILKSDPEDMSEEQISFVDEIMKSGAHLLDLINDVLELSKIEAGELSLNIDNIDIRLVIDDSLSMTSMLAEKYGVEIVNMVGDTEYPLIRTDKLRIKQILINLVSNAIKYNVPDGKVFVFAEALMDGYLRLSVKDTGKGIPSDVLDAIWEPFNRIGAEATTVEGTGIGLSVTKRVVDLLNGRVGVESEEGVGSCFWVELPIATSVYRRHKRSGQIAS